MYNYFFSYSVTNGETLEKDVSLTRVRDFAYESYEYGANPYN